MPYTKQTWANNSSGGTPIDADRLNYMETGIYNVSATSTFTVKAYGAVGDGVADDTVAVQAAITAASVAGGEVYFPAGTYLLTSPVTVASRTVSLRGGGLGSIIKSTGAGAVLVQYTFSVEQAGSISDLTFEGGSGVAGYGIKLINTIGFELRNVVVQNYTSGQGIWLEAVCVVPSQAPVSDRWVERTTMDRVHVQNCLTGVYLHTNATAGITSFGFSRISDLRLNVNVGQTGIYFGDKCYAYNWYLGAMVNMGGAGTFINVATGSYLVSTDVSLFGEQTSGSGGAGITTAGQCSIQGVVELGTLTNGAFGWTDVTAFGGTWVNFGGGQRNAQYRKKGDEVQLRGIVKNGASGIIFTLPVGYRNTNIDRWACPAGASFAYVAVYPDGGVRLETGGDGTWIDLSAVKFSIL